MTPAEFIAAHKLPPTEGVHLIARLCHVSPSAVWYWLAGDRKHKPAHALLLRIFTECTPAQRAAWWKLDTPTQKG